MPSTKTRIAERCIRPPTSTGPHRVRAGAKTSVCAAAVLSVLTLAACGGTGTSSGAGAGQTGATSQDGAAKPAGVQQLTIGYGGDPWVDAPEADQKRKPNYPLNADVCQTLVKLTPDFKITDGLASKWEYVGKNTFRFTLKDGPTFSDGSPVTAKDVKYTLDYSAKDPNTSGFGFIGPKSTKVIDKRTVEVTPTAPNLRLLEQITHPTYSILKSGSDPLKDVNSLVCSGPFKVSKYVPNERLVVTRNDNYWGTPAKLKKITFRFIPDDTTRTLALQSGQVDLIADVPRAVLPSLKGRSDVKLVESPIGQVLLGYLAQRKAEGMPRLLSDPAVRRAVAASINQKAYVDGVLGGNGKPFETVAPPSVLGKFASMVKGIPYDPKAAARLLDGAGWKLGSDGVRTKDGRPLKLDIAFSAGGGGTGIDLTTVEFVQAQLTAVGIKANVLQLDPGAYQDHLDRGTYDIDLSGPNQNDANPAFLMSLRWYSKATGKNAKVISPGPDTEFEKLVDQTQKATDRQQLTRLAAEAMHQLVDVNVGVMPLAGVNRIYAMKDSVAGFVAHPSGTNQRWSSVFRTR